MCDARFAFSIGLSSYLASNDVTSAPSANAFPGGHLMYYNFARIHLTLKTTPAVAAGVADRVWTIEEMVKLLDSK